MSRVVWLVMDSVGIGALPHAQRFDDAGADTLGHIAQWCMSTRGRALQIPTLVQLGLGQAYQLVNRKLLPGVSESDSSQGCHGAARERSTGKDTVSGHWELCGLPVDFDWGYFEARSESLPSILGSDSPAMPFSSTKPRISPSCVSTTLPPPEAEAHYLCADPVNLHFAREHLLLTPLRGDALNLADAQALADTLDAFFKPLDANILGFEVAAPERWYLKLANAPRTAFFPLDDVTGRPVSHFMPEGEESREWQRLVNEIQVLLHNHPLNQARETAGERPVNSVWLWGDGDALPTPQHLPNQVLTRDLVTRGLARTLGVPLGAADALPQADALVVIDTLLKPSLALDLPRIKEK